MKTTDFKVGDRFKIKTAAWKRDKLTVILVTPEKIRCDLFNGNGSYLGEIDFTQKNLDAYDNGDFQFLERAKMAA